MDSLDKEEPESPKQGFTRREFVQLVAIGAGAAVLSACVAPVTQQGGGQQAGAAGQQPSQSPEAIELDVWWNADIPDLTIT